MKKYNKATATVVAGALTAILGSFVLVDQEVLVAIQTLVTAILVWFVPNKES